MSENTVNTDDLEWEEWDGKSPFLHHCLAGSIAGISEHVLLYPFDTIKTHMQSYCADCPHNNHNNNTALKNGQAAMSSISSSSRSSMKVGEYGMWRTMQNLVHNGHSRPHSTASTNEMVLGRHTIGNGTHSTRRATNLVTSYFSETAAKSSAERLFASSIASTTIASNNHYSTGFIRLWRGVQTMAVGCAPAHALYFSSYEMVKSLFLTHQNNDQDIQHHLSPLGSSVAGATATLFHDLIMTPLDTLKQRLQLGHYEGMYNGFQHIVEHEGYGGLYRSFPVTLLTNIPYGMIMVSTNEFLKEILNPDGKFDLESSLLAGCGAGFTASAVTTPLDRVKTRLQTQALGSTVTAVEGTTFSGTALSTVKTPCGNRTTKCGKLILAQPSVKYAGWKDALHSIIREEGYVGLFRGIAPRVMMHSPAVAISWTTYEGAKKWLLTSN